MFKSLIENLFKPITPKEHTERREDLYRMMDDFFAQVKNVFANDVMASAVIVTFADKSTDAGYGSIDFCWTDLFHLSKDPKWKLLCAESKDLLNDYKRWKMLKNESLFKPLPEDEVTKRREPLMKGVPELVAWLDKRYEQHG